MTASNHVGCGVLGPLEMTVGGAPMPSGSRKQRAVLAMLLINRNRVVGSETLAAAPPGYRLTPSDTNCDIGRFISERIAGTRAAATGQFELASCHLSAALAEWRGRMLEGLPEMPLTPTSANTGRDGRPKRSAARNPENPDPRSWFE